MNLDRKVTDGPDRTAAQRAEIAETLRANEGLLGEALHRVFRAHIFKNDSTVDPKRLAQLPSEELRHLHRFLTEGNAERVFTLGKTRAEEGLHIKSVLGMSGCLTRFFVENKDIADRGLTTASVSLVSDYMSAYLEGYGIEKTDKTIRQQQEIRSVLSTALFGQQNELFIRNHALGSSINAIVLSDLQRRVTYVNASFLNMWGYARVDEVLAIGHIDRLIGEAVDAIFESLTRLRTWRGELTLKRRDGTEVDVEMAASLIIDEDDNRFGIMASFIDITMRKRMASQLNRSQKMEALGQLAAGITHDFNNMFAVVKGYLHLILRDADPDSQLFDDIKHIQIAIDRSSGLTKQLQYFARGVDGEKALVDMNTIIEESYTLLSHSFPPGIELRLDLDSALWMIEADASQMSHSIINLCVNARDAVIAGYDASNNATEAAALGGAITISTANQILDERAATLHLKATPGRYVRVSIRDTGIGMTREVQDRLFEPFYTTKTTEKNMGLGLSIIYGIVEKLNGFIDVESKVGEGSTFHLYFPESKRAAAFNADEDDSLYPMGDDNTVLIVDDEPEIRNVLARHLTCFGYRTLAAENGKAAVDLYGREHARIGVVILDMIMPEMDGESCLRSIRDIDPKVEVLLMTGFTTDESVIERMKSLSDAVIEKPFDLKKLSTKLRGMQLRRRQAK